MSREIWADQVDVLRSITGEIGIRVKDPHFGTTVIWFKHRQRVPLKNEIERSLHEHPPEEP